MRKIEGLYSAISAVINKREQEKRLAADVGDIIEEVKQEVDVYSASLDWYIQFALRAAVEVGLYQKGYRSVVKGEGIFVNPEHCKRPEYIARMINNAKLTATQKEKAVALLQKTIKSSGIEGQLTFNQDGTVFEEVTERQLIEMLRADASGDE